MAIKRLVIDGYGQLELNNVAFRRDGRVEAQCALATEDFADAVAENGMLLAVDNVTRTVKFATDDELPIAINYSAEHMYENDKFGLKDFSLSLKDGFCPRLGYLSVGDKFTTNCIAYDDTEYSTEEDLKEALEQTALEDTPVYGGISDIGAIKVSATKPTVGPVLLAVKGYTMPDGQFGVKFQTLKA